MLMEKIEWPPSGPMSMVLTQLLYVNFSKDESVQLSWDGKYFDELLKKIKECVPEVVSQDSGSNTDAKERQNGQGNPRSDNAPTMQSGDDTQKKKSSTCTLL
jgi:hypothetical protein